MNINIKKSNRQLIAITIGDIDGIGIHLLMKEFIGRKIKNFVLITNIKIFNKKINYPATKINNINVENFKYENKKLNIINFTTKNKNTNTIDSLKLAYKLTKNKFFIGILTLPLNKKKINKFVSNSFIDQTSFFSKLENSNSSNMFFIHKNNFFIPLTIHIELKEVYKRFKNKQNIKNKILSIIDTLKYDFKINKPKLIISGINPHAGEHGIISKDDDKYLKPLIKHLKSKKINITGPISGDGMVNNYNLDKYDAFIFAYHDQALIPFKLLSQYEGVNFTSKLNIIRTSPSHGTAENLIGTNLATSKGILSSFKLIKIIAKNRLKN